jgi:hypothetical protein
VKYIINRNHELTVQAATEDDGIYLGSFNTSLMEALGIFVSEKNFYQNSSKVEIMAKII